MAKLPAGSKDKLIQRVRALSGFLGAYSVISSAIEKGANIGAKIKHGDDALSLAARCGKLGSVKALIKAGADIHATDYNDNTVLIACNASVSVVLRWQSFSLMLALMSMLGIMRGGLPS